MQTRSVTLPAFLYLDVMDLYATDPVTGAYTVLVEPNLACRLAETSKKDVAAGQLRAEGLEFRTLLFPPEVVMDPLYQVQISGHRWQIQSGTDQVARGPRGELVYRSVDVAHAPQAAEAIDP